MMGVGGWSQSPVDTGQEAGYTITFHYFNNVWSCAHSVRHLESLWQHPCRVAHIQNVKVMQSTKEPRTNCVQTTEKWWNTNVASKNLFAHPPHAECIVLKVENYVYMMAECSEKPSVLKLCHFASPYDGHRTYYQRQPASFSIRTEQTQHVAAWNSLWHHELPVPTKRMGWRD